MDRDLALKLKDSLNSIKTTMAALATNTTPTTADSRSVAPDPDSRSVSSAPAEDLRSAPEEESEAEPESVPETTTRKRTTSK